MWVLSLAPIACHKRYAGSAKFCQLEHALGFQGLFFQNAWEELSRVYAAVITCSSFDSIMLRNILSGYSLC